MEILIPIVTLVLGAVLNETFTYFKGRRARKDARADRLEQFQAQVLGETLLALDTAYNAASAIAHNSDQLGSRLDRSESLEQWKIREPLVQACAAAAIALDSRAVLLPEGSSPRVEIEAMARAAVDMTGLGTARELRQRWQPVDPAFLSAKAAVGKAIWKLYSAAPAKLSTADRKELPRPEIDQQPPS